jgi:hypothetical protein
MSYGGNLIFSTGNTVRYNTIMLDSYWYKYFVLYYTVQSLETCRDFYISRPAEFFKLIRFTRVIMRITVRKDLVYRERVLLEKKVLDVEKGFTKIRVLVLLLLVQMVRFAFCRQKRRKTRFDERYESIKNDPLNLVNSSVKVLIR